MESLKVKNFLTIKEADFEVKRINIIIGPQATGKSIIAKLLYFFRKFVSDIYFSKLFNTEIDFKKGGIEHFKKYFPQYTWSYEEFEITYKLDKLKVSIFCKLDENLKTIMKLDYSKELDILYERAEIRQGEDEIPDAVKKNIVDSFERLSPAMQKEVCYPYFRKKEFIKQPIFIPAGRSFFAALQKNIFSFLLAKDLNIDPFILEFGSEYEKCKIHYRGVTGCRLHAPNQALRAKIKEITETILAGKYEYKEAQDWIEQNGRDINISQASSGQQEVLPMLIILSVLTNLGDENTFFIEEPEAHLFPVSQKNIVSLIGTIYNHKSNNFVITTHSPYILSAFNNLIFGYEVSKKNDIEKIKKIIDPDSLINYQDVSAYTINNGVLESIKDDETKLIGASIIDSVSDDLSEIFDSLIELDMSV